MMAEEFINHKELTGKQWQETSIKLVAVDRSITYGIQLYVKRRHGLNCSFCITQTRRW